MKRPSFFFILLRITTDIHAQMKTDSITVAPDLVVCQTNTTESKDTLVWTLSLSKKGKKVLVLDSQKISDISDPINNFDPFSLENDIYLRTPNLIDAFKDHKDLYVFVYENRGIYFYRYHFTEGVTYTKTKYFIDQMGGGSIANFGGYSHDIQKSKMGHEYYFFLKYGRSVGWSSTSLLHLNIRSNTLNKLDFSENYLTVKDDNKLFYALNLDQNKQHISNTIASLLIQNHQLNNKQKFSYLGYMDDFSSFYSVINGTGRSSGTIYFFYLIDLIPKIITYDSYEYQWLIGDYTEQEIKQMKDKRK